MCDPDFNAYNRTINNRPFSDDFTLRSSGAHIHCGFDNIQIPFKEGYLHNYNISDDDQRVNIVKTLDLFISIPLVIIEPESKRKELYGKAGAFRPKAYGLEYRTPSNFYLTSEKLMKWVYNNVKLAFDFLNNNNPIDEMVSKHIQEVINTNNKKDAQDLINNFNIQMD